MKLLLLTLLFTVAFAQFGQRCKQTPPRWSGLMREVEYRAQGSFFRFARIDYDEVAQKIHILEYEKFSNGRTEEADELFDFRAGKSYRAERGGECQINELRDPFRTFGIPPDAEFEGVEYLGALSSTYGLLVDHFHYIVQDRLGGGSAWYSFAPNMLDISSCYPVTIAFANMDAPLPLKSDVHFTFMNITSVIPSGAFDIPSNCEP